MFFYKVIDYLSYQSIDKNLGILHIGSFLFDILPCFIIVSSKIESAMLTQREEEYSITRRFVLESKIMTSNAGSSYYFFIMHAENHE